MIAEGHHGVRSIRFQIHVPRQQTRQQQVALPAVLPATRRQQSDGGLLDKLVFGVGVGHGGEVVLLRLITGLLVEFLRNQKAKPSQGGAIVPLGPILQEQHGTNPRSEYAFPRNLQRNAF